MNLQFYGPLGRVTGSCALLTDERLGIKILIDAGIQQGEGDPEAWNRGELPFDPAALTHIVLTHAHIDHCGLLPRIVRAGFAGRVLCTPETAELARIQLDDCARVSGDYTVADAHRVRFDERDAAFGTYFPIARNVFLQFFRTAHILGAVAVRLSWGPKGPAQRSIIFSGDLGTNVDGHERFLLLRHRMEPPPSTYAVVESTYGDRERALSGESFIGRTEMLRQQLRAGVARGGPTLIAVFAMDRLQTVLLDLAYLAGMDAVLARTPVFVHAPLGRRISSVYARFVRAKDICRTGVRSRWLSKSAFVRFGLDPESADDERRLEDAIVGVLDPTASPTTEPTLLQRTHRWTDTSFVPTEPCILVASSGMLEGGPVVQYLSALLRDPTATIVLPGYAPPTTLAGKLLKIGGLTLADRQRLADELNLPDGTTISSAKVVAHVTAATGYSGHADQRGLLDWLVHEHEGRTCVAGRTIFIQHGTDAGRDGLRRALQEHAPGVEVVCPSPEAASYDLDERSLPSRDELLARIAELEARLTAAHDL